MKKLLFALALAPLLAPCALPLSVCKYKAGSPRPVSMDSSPHSYKNSILKDSISVRLRPSVLGFDRGEFSYPDNALTVSRLFVELPLSTSLSVATNKFSKFEKDCSKALGVSFNSIPNALPNLPFFDFANQRYATDNGVYYCLLLRKVVRRDTTRGEVMFYEIDLVIDYTVYLREHQKPKTIKPHLM